MEGQESLSLNTHKPHLPNRPIVLLLGVSATLLLGVGSMLFSTPHSPPHTANSSDMPHPAPTIEGKSDLQLKADLVRVNQELARAKSEREETLKAIEQVSSTLEQRLKEANLSIDE
jgi:hypothetical protein